MHFLCISDLRKSALLLKIYEVVVLWVSQMEIRSKVAFSWDEIEAEREGLNWRRTEEQTKIGESQQPWLLGNLFSFQKNVCSQQDDSFPTV